MRPAIAVFLLFAAVFFFWYDFFLASLLCIIIAVYALLHQPLKGFGSETMKQLEESEGQVPGKEVWEEGLKAAGSMVGAQAFSDKENVARLKDIEVTKWRLRENKVGGASKKTIDLFKKLFG